MFASVARPSNSSSGAALAPSSSSFSLPAPPSYSYSVASPSYEASAAVSPSLAALESAPLPLYYAPNPNLRLDASYPAYSPPSASSTAGMPSSSALPTSYAPSVPAAYLTQVAPSMRIYPAFHETYKAYATPPASMAPSSVAPPSAVSSAYSSSHSSLSQSAQSEPLAERPFAPLSSAYPPSGSCVSPSGAAPSLYPYLHSNLATAAIPHTYSYAAASSAYPPTAVAAVSAAPSALTPAASPIYSPTPSSPPAQSSVPAAPLNDSVHLASFQAQVAEEKWLMTEARESERRRKSAEAERERDRLRQERQVSFSNSLRSHLGSLFIKKPSGSGSSGSSPRHRLPVGLSLDSKPPSQVDSTPAPVTSAHATRHLLTDQFVYNEQFPTQRFVRHVVVPTDDLVDLAVRYDTTPDLIRRHNRRVVFQHLDNVHGEYIHIPVSDSFVLPQPVLPAPSAGERKDGDGRASEDSYVVPGAGGLTNVELKLQSEINRQFYAVRSFLSQLARRRGASSLGGPRSAVVPHIGDAGESIGDEVCSENEATFYLSESNYNVHAALVAYTEDCEWERRELELKKQQSEQAQGRLVRPQPGGGGARDGRRDAGGKPYSSLALAVAQAKQARLSALSNDANAAQRQQDFIERRLRKRFSMQQAAKKRGGPQQSLATPLLPADPSSPSSPSSPQLGQAAGLDGRGREDGLMAEYGGGEYGAGPAFVYYQQSLPSPAS